MGGGGQAGENLGGILGARIATCVLWLRYPWVLCYVPVGACPALELSSERRKVRGIAGGESPVLWQNIWGAVSTAVSWVSGFLGSGDSLLRLPYRSIFAPVDYGNYTGWWGSFLCLPRCRALQTGLYTCLRETGCQAGRSFWTAAPRPVSPPARGCCPSVCVVGLALMALPSSSQQPEQWAGSQHPALTICRKVTPFLWLRSQSRMRWRELGPPGPSLGPVWPEKGQSRHSACPAAMPTSPFSPRLFLSGR